MARGAEAKLRRRNQKKEAKAKAEEMLSSGNTHDFGPAAEENNEDDDLPQPPSASTGHAPIEEDSSAEEEDDIPKPIKNKARKAQKNRANAAAAAAAASKKQGIKTMPLVLLVLLTGTTLLPAVLYAGDWIGNFAQKHHIVGGLGYKLGIGASPKKRVLSFYEKHDPSKINDVDKIMSKHYGNYPQLIKKLERKYQDYGYFLGWENDEAPMTLAIDKLVMTREYIVDQFYLYAPQPLKTAATNVKYNLTFLYKRGAKLWKRKIWPLLEPVFGVPKGTQAQKRKDAREARERAASKTKKRKSHEFRDEEDEHV